MIVSASAGEPYKDKLLALPGFLRSGASGSGVTAKDIADGFRLTGFFLEQRVLEPRGLQLPDARSRLAAQVA